jgi:hypothetical protein
MVHEREVGKGDETGGEDDNIGGTGLEVDAIGVTGTS